MWYDMLEWLLSGGVIPNHPQLKEDLSVPTFNKTPVSGKMFLESVDDMEKRGEKSPDFGTALALTLAYEVAPSTGFGNTGMGKVVDTWDVYRVPEMK